MYTRPPPLESASVNALSAQKDRESVGMKCPCPFEVTPPWPPSNTPSHREHQYNRTRETRRCRGQAAGGRHEQELRCPRAGHPSAPTSTSLDLEAISTSPLCPVVDDASSEASTVAAEHDPSMFPLVCSPASSPMVENDLSDPPNGATNSPAITYGREDWQQVGEGNGTGDRGWASIRHSVQVETPPVGKATRRRHRSPPGGSQHGDILPAHGEQRERRRLQHALLLARTSSRTRAFERTRTRPLVVKTLPTARSPVPHTLPLRVRQTPQDQLSQPRTVRHVILLCSERSV